MPNRARPTSSSAPPKTSARPSCLELIDGIVALAAATGTTVAGGDVTRAPALTLAVTVVGHAATPEQLVGRGGAQPGDALVLTGELGGAAAGLLLLERPELAAAVPAATAEQLRLRQLEPTPRLAAGRALAAAGARLDDRPQRRARRRRRPHRHRERRRAPHRRRRLPLASGVAEIATAAGLDPLQLATSGGEDYELLATLAPQCLEEAKSMIDGGGETKLTQVGEVVAGAGVEIRLRGGGLLARGRVRPARPPPTVSSSLTPRRCSIAAATREGSGL